MNTAFALGAVFPMSLGLSCCLFGRRVDWAAAAAMALMVIGMIDTMLLGSRFLPISGWVIGYVAAAAALLLLSDRDRLAAARAGQLVAMAALTVVMPTMSDFFAVSVEAADMHHHGHGAGTSAEGGQVLLVGALAVALVYVTYAALRLFRSICWSAKVELATGIVAVAAMAGMVVL